MQFYQIPRTLSLGKDRNPCEVPFNWAIARPRFSNFCILKFLECKMAFKFLFSILTLRSYFKGKSYLILWFVKWIIEDQNTSQIHPENLHDPSNIICYTVWVKKNEKEKNRARKQISTYLKVLSSVYEVLYLTIIEL